MSFLFTLEEDRLTEQLPEIFAAAELEIRKAEPLFQIQGERLEVLARDLPKHQGHFALKSQEMKQLMKWLENYKAKQEAIILKNYTRNNQRVLSASDQKILLAGEKDIVETNQLIIEAALMHGKFEEVTEAFRQMGWMLGHITKLRVAELGDIII